MDAKEILLTVAATALGLPKDEVEAKPEDAEDENPLSTLLNLHKEKVKKLKEDNLNNGEKKARAEVLTKREKEIKERYGLESDKIGFDLIDELLEVKTKEILSEAGESEEKDGKKKPISLKDIPEDLVKKHPLYLQKEKEVKDVEATITRKWQSEVEAVKAEYAEKQTFDTVSKRALTEFEKLNPLLSPDPDKAARQKAIFLNELKNNKYEFVGDDILVLDENGNKREDEHGHTLKFSEQVRKAAEKYFDFKVAEDRTSPGVTNSTKAPGGKLYTGKQPTNQEEYAKLVTDKNLTVEQRLEIQKDWQEKQTSNV